MADKANLYSEGSLAAWTGDGGDAWERGSGFPGLSPLLCYSCPVGLAHHVVVVSGGALFSPVLGSLLSGVRVDVKRSQGMLFLSVSEVFLLACLRALSVLGLGADRRQHPNASPRGCLRYVFQCGYQVLLRASAPV